MHRSLCLRVGILAVATAAIGVLALACGPDPVGPESCRQIEEARCRRAPACGIQLSPPEHRKGSEIDACIRYYRDSCLHGMVIGNEPGELIVRDCVAAITSGDCAVVKDPGVSPACGFLTPKPAEPVEAAAPVDAGDAG